MSCSILVVDDELLIRTLVKRILSEHGYAIKDAGSGQEALSILRTNESFDLLLTDLKMPKMHGRELADQAQSIRAGLPVVFMSGYSDTAATLLTSSDEFVQKPFTAVSLIATIKLALERHSSRKAERISKEPQVSFGEIGAQTAASSTTSPRERKPGTSAVSPGARGSSGDMAAKLMRVEWQMARKKHTGS